MDSALRKALATKKAAAAAAAAAAAKVPDTAILNTAAVPGAAGVKKADVVSGAGGKKAGGGAAAAAVPAAVLAAANLNTAADAVAAPRSAAVLVPGVRQCSQLFCQKKAFVMLLWNKRRLLRTRMWLLSKKRSKHKGVLMKRK